MGSNKHEDNLKRVGPQEGPLKKAIQRYIGDYEALWSLLLEPSEHFEVEEGQIPCPRDLGSVGRRMVSVMDVRDKPSVHHWDGVGNREKFMTKEQMVLSYEIYLVSKQIKKTYVVPSNEALSSRMNGTHGRRKLVLNRL